MKLTSLFKVKIIVTIIKEIEALIQALKLLKLVISTEIKYYQCDKLSHITSKCSQKKVKTKILKKTDDIIFDESSKFNLDILNLENK